MNARSYKPAWKCEDAYDLIVSERGKQFDPQVVDAFIRCYPELTAMYDRIAGDTAAQSS